MALVGSYSVLVEIDTTELHAFFLLNVFLNLDEIAMSINLATSSYSYTVTLLTALKKISTVSNLVDIAGFLP